MLSEYNHPVFPVGIKGGKIGSLEILTNNPFVENIDTLTLYLGPKNQTAYYDYILNTISPKRIIFNPGTENQELQKLAEQKGIQTQTSCTLVLLSIDSF